MSVSPRKGARIAENTYKYELGRARRDITAVAFVIVHAGGGNLAASFSVLYLLSTSSLSYSVKVLTRK